MTSNPRPQTILPKPQNQKTLNPKPVEAVPPLAASSCKAPARAREPCTLLVGVPVLGFGTSWVFRV